MEPLKKIEVNFTPGTIEFPSADRLKLYVNETLEKTKGLVATDDSIKATKASRTEVNKLEKSIADVRKRYKKAWNEPFSAFESSLKELEGDCKAASQELKETIDSFENQQKEERRKVVQGLINEIDTETGELKHELQRVSLELQGTKEQIDDIARYIVKSGVKIVSSSERETVIE